MKGNKKLLCVLLTVAFMLCISTTAFAAEQLDAPTGLTWNQQIDGTEKYGVVSWNTVTGCEGNYNIQLYKDGTEIYSTHFYGAYGTNGRVSFDFRESINESGTYTVKIYAEGNEDNYSDSAIVTSEPFNYVRPAKELVMPSNLAWVNLTRYWSNIDGCDSYDIEYYKQEQDDERRVGSSGLSLARVTIDGEQVYTNDDWLYHLINDEKNGAGIYSFNVRALSPDITVVANSARSTDRPRTNIATTASDIADTLKGWNSGIADGTTTASAVRFDVINKINTAELAASMVSTDTVRDEVEKLENSYKTSTGITVTTEVSADAQGTVSTDGMQIIGAGLNAVKDNDKVKFQIKKTNDNYTYRTPEEYKNTVFLDMNVTAESLDLKDNGELKVPVYIKMQVPSNITKKENFRILHFKQSSDEFELIIPVVAKEADGTWYASFAVTHFSPFAFVEVKTAEEAAGGEEPTDPSEPSKPSTGGSSGGGFSGSYNYPVKTDSVDGATVSFDKSNAVAGDKVVITVTPDSGKRVDEVIVTDGDDEVITVTKVGDNKYSFIMPESAVKVAVTTEEAEYDTRVVLQIGNKNVVINNRTVSNDVTPVIVDSRTMVPIRVVTEALGGSADWNEAARMVTLTIDGKVLRMTIDQTIDGFDAAPVIINSRTYVPIRYVAEALGADVEWIAETQQIIIEK